jgi:HlyD family secretion protein
VDRVTVIAEVGGMVLQMNADVSDQLQAGDVIAIIDSAMLEAQRAQALAGLAAAQAQLDLTLDTADEEDLAAAKAGVAAASAAYQRALAGPTEEEQRMALAQLKQAEAAVHVAQAAYNRVKGNPLIGGMPESMQLQQATLAVEAAQAQYDKLLKGATADVIAGAYAQLTQARAQLNRLEEGAKDAQKDAARAQVKQAETALYLAQLQLDKATVHAPIDGIVSQVHTTEGAMVGPGTPILTLRSEDVEVTIAVEENRMEEIEIGQEARIQVEAYPDRIFQGEVIRIASELNPSTRTVAVTIQPTEDASDLLPGMFATVELLK